MVQKEIYKFVMFCARDKYYFFGGGEAHIMPGGGWHMVYGANKRGEVKTKPEMKRPYWVRSSSIAWSLTLRHKFVR